MSGTTDEQVLPTMARIWIEEMGKPKPELLNILLRIREVCALPKERAESMLVVGSSQGAVLWERERARLVAVAPGIIICSVGEFSDYTWYCSGVLRRSPNGRGYSVRTFAGINGDMGAGHAWFDAWATKPGQSLPTATFYWAVRTDDASRESAIISASRWKETRGWIELWLPDE